MQNDLLFSNKTEDNFSLERFLLKIGYTSIAGCDEAGRGPLAGPVVASAVVLPKDCDHTLFLDSKILSHKKRVVLRNHLKEIQARVGIGVVSEKEIDKINILQASLLAMKIAVENLPGIPTDFILVDGKQSVPIDVTQESFIKGEQKSSSIAAASIVAKVERDRIMAKHHDRFPEYRFDKNKGYPTKQHRDLLKQYGPCPIHRKSFKGVREHVK